MGWVRRHWVSCVIVLAGAIAVAAYYPYSQQGRMAKAERHIPRLQQMIGGDARFTGIGFDPFTGRGGSLLVSGTVASEADRDALVAMVQRSNPPVDVVYGVRIAATTQAVVVLRLDNRGGFSHGGVRVRALSDGTCERELYSDVPGPGEVQRGTCVLDDAAGMLTVSMGAERWELRRVVHERVRYWLGKRDTERIGGADEAGMWQTALREVQR